MTARLLTAAALCAGLAVPANAETFRLSVGSGHPESAVWISTMKNYMLTEISKRVAERTDHEIEWTEAFGSSVCKLGECLEAVEAGLLDMAQIQTPFDPAKLQAHNFAYFVPFGLTDPVMGSEAFWQVYENVPELKSMLTDNYNQTFIAVGTIGDYGLSTTFPWETVAELEGQKIAAAGPNLPWLEGTGTVPVQTTLNEAYTSLQTGVYEGWIMFVDALVSFKLIEVAKHFADLGFGVIPTPLITINNDTFNELPPEVQEIFIEVGRDWNKHNGEAIAAAAVRSIEAMKEAGVTIVEVDDAQRAVWAEGLQNLPGVRYQEVLDAGQPAEAIYEYIRIAEEMGHVFPRDWKAERP